MQTSPEGLRHEQASKGQSHPARLAAAAAVLVIFAGLLFWGNYRYSLASPGGSDFLVHWEGTRVYLTRGISPYSDQAAASIQTMAYGRPALPGEHELRVAYPLYSALLFAPFALIPDFPTARAAWMTLLEAALIGMAFISLRLGNWRPKPLLLAVVLVFTLLWYFSLRGLINGNAVILVAAAFAGAFLLIRSGKDVPAALLLAFTTIKPQVAILPLIWVLLWAYSVRRWKLVTWTVGAVAGLVLLAMLFIPDWPLQNLREILRYPGYNPPGTPGAAFAVWWPSFGHLLGWVLSLGIAVLLIYEWRRAWGNHYPAFFWTACITLIAAQWSGIQTDPGNFIVLFVPLIAALAGWERKSSRSGPLVTALILVVLFIGLWGLFMATVEQVNNQPQQSPVMFFPLPALLLVAFYALGRKRLVEEV